MNCCILKGFQPRSTRRAETGSLGAGVQIDGGRGGDIDLEADSVRILGGGSLSANTFGRGTGGTIKVRATKSVEMSSSDSIVPDGGTPRFTSIGAVSFGLTEGGPGGDISITTERLEVLAGARLNASSTSAGNGGSITIDPRFVLLNRSAIIADAQFGRGGNINIVSDFFLSSESLISASSRFGLQGSIVISAPDLDLSGSLTRSLGWSWRESHDCLSTVPDWCPVISAPSWCWVAAVCPQNQGAGGPVPVRETSSRSPRTKSEQHVVVLVLEELHECHHSVGIRRVRFDHDVTFEQNAFKLILFPHRSARRPEAEQHRQYQE